VGTPDGVYGTATQRAVAQFQTAAHLTSDGVFGPATLAALAGALNGP
jgi:g-D-glutamyl-meso-diaminopimelate peptidase